MPETTLNQYRRSVARKNQVGDTGQLSDVKALTEARTPNRSANVSLDRCAPVFDTGHKGRATFFG